MNMEVEDSATNNYPYAEIDIGSPSFSAYDKINRHIWEQFQQYKKSQLPQTITVLYPEILVKIFSHLNLRDFRSIPRVCKSWRDAAYSKCLWQNVEVRLDLVERKCPSFTSLAQLGIKKLYIRSIEKHLPELVVVLPNLKSLTLTECYSDGSKVWEFPDCVPHLALLNLSSCRQLTDKCLGQIALHCNNLSKLELDNCDNITDCSLMLIAWGLKKLQVLSFRSCNAITNLGIKHIVGHSSSPSSDGKHLLECLMLEKCTKISDTALKYISDGIMEHLKTIKLTDCINITNIGLKHLSNISSLRELRIKGSPRITDTGIVYLVQDGSKLDVFDIAFVSTLSASEMASFLESFHPMRVMKYKENILVANFSR